MQTSIRKRTAHKSLRTLAFAGLASIISISAASAQMAAPTPANQYRSYYREVPVSRPVSSTSEINTRDPYHLPESYNYDWPYGEGLGH